METLKGKEFNDVRICIASDWYRHWYHRHSDQYYSAFKEELIMTSKKQLHSPRLAALLIG